MLTESMQKALNEQINHELYSTHLYLSIAAYYDAVSLDGFSHWMRMQAEEETVHAMKFFDYISDRGGRVLMAGIEAPPTEWQSPQAAFEAALEHEKKVTGLIHGLVELARADKDYATENFLQWFVAEQVEEEASVDAVLQRLVMVKDHNHGLLMIDRELAGRAAPGQD